MKKNLFLCLCGLMMAVLCSCTSNVVKNPDVEQVICPSRNCVIALPQATNVSVENTERGCEVYFDTELGRQLFILPYHYELDKMAKISIPTTDGDKKLKPFRVFGKENAFFDEGKPENYPDKGIAFRLSPDAVIVFVALNGIDAEKLRSVRVGFDTGDFQVGKRDYVYTADIVSLCDGYANQLIIPIFEMESLQRYSEDTRSAKSLFGEGILGGLYVEFK